MTRVNLGAPVIFAETVFMVAEPNRAYEVVHWTEQLQFPELRIIDTSATLGPPVVPFYAGFPY